MTKLSTIRLTVPFRVTLMNPIKIATMDDVRAAESAVRQHVSPTPLVRSYALERTLGLPARRQVWLKDYGWSPSGSFKVMGALGWMSVNEHKIGDRPVAASSSGNFASGLSFACGRYGKRAIILMPDTAPRIKFELTRSFGAEVRTYDISRDHLTGDRERMIREIATDENAVLASPYDDNAVIAGNGVGGLEIAQTLRDAGRMASTLACPVSGGGLLAGLSLSLSDAFAGINIVAVEPQGADDFHRSLSTGTRTSLDKPTSICDGLLSYDVGHHNWPILKRCVGSCALLTDDETTDAMRWIYDHHGIRTEPSGAIAVAALLQGRVDLSGDGDIVAIISGRNIDESTFREFLNLGT